MCPTNCRSRGNGSLRSRNSTSCDSHADASELDDVADLELTSTADLDVAVHRDHAVGDEGLSVSAGFDQVGELQELAQPDAPVTDLNVVHPLIVPPGRSPVPLGLR